MAYIHFFQPIFLLDFVPTPTLMEDHQNIADYINQSQKYALNRTIIAFVQFGDNVQSRGLMVVAHGGRSDIDQRFITQKDILESEILMTLGYVLKKECCHTVCSNLFNKNGIYEL